MSKETTGAAAVDFTFEAFDAVDTADMSVMVGGRITDWKWTFAGPGHPLAIEQSNRTARERLHIEAEQTQARVNGRKWKAPDESVDEVRARNISYVVERLVGWSPVNIGGAAYPFSAENARKLLADPKKVGLLTQALEFIAADNSFTKRSA